MNHEVEREEGELAKLRRDLAQSREDYDRACQELNLARITIGEREVLHQTEQAKLRRLVRGLGMRRCLTLEERKELNALLEDE